MSPRVPVSQTHVEGVEPPRHIPGWMLDQPQHNKFNKRGKCVLETVKEFLDNSFMKFANRKELIFSKSNICFEVVNCVRQAMRDVEHISRSLHRLVN